MPRWHLAPLVYSLTHWRSDRPSHPISRRSWTLCSTVMAIFAYPMLGMTIAVPLKVSVFARQTAPNSTDLIWTTRHGPLKGFSLLNLPVRSEEHTSELHSLMRISYAVFCLKTQISIS